MGRKLLSGEISNMKSVQHPNIVNLFEVFYTAHAAYLVMEYCTGGNLKDLVAS